VSSHRTNTPHELPTRQSIHKQLSNLRDVLIQSLEAPFCGREGLQNRDTHDAGSDDKPWGRPELSRVVEDHGHHGKTAGDGDVHEAFFKATQLSVTTSGSLWRDPGAQLEATNGGDESVNGGNGRGAIAPVDAEMPREHICRAEEGDPDHLLLPDADPKPRPKRHARKGVYRRCVVDDEQGRFCLLDPLAMLYLHAHPENAKHNRTAVAGEDAPRIEPRFPGRKQQQEREEQHGRGDSEPEECGSNAEPGRDKAMGRRALHRTNLRCAAMARDPLDKVRKLLALSRSTNVHEAAAAAARAQELIDRYRLEELLEAEESATQDPVEEEVLETARRQRRWKTVLAARLAEINCSVAFLREEGRQRHIVLAGRAADRSAVRSLWDWLVPQLEWLSATHGAGHDKRWHDDFRIGAVETIAARLTAVGEAEHQLVPPKALTRIEPVLVARRDALKAFTDRHLTTKSGRALLVGVDAWRAGKEAANAVSLGTPDEAG